MTHSPSTIWSDADVSELIAANPLAWIVSGGGDFAATVMPMLLDLDGAGHPVSLTGHFPRSHPQFRQLRDDPRALFLFQGPHGYLSPGLVSRKTWAPTWNFAVVRIVAEVAFDDRLTDEALERLVTHMEGQPAPWSTASMGARYGQLRASVMGFRASILELTARFKLGQDENPAELTEILEHMEDGALNRLMKRFNGR
jgi:transcriptional regulator